MSDWRDRLAAELAIRGIKRTRLSLSLGFNRDYITRMLKKDSNPSAKRIKAVCDAVGVSFTYIYTGEKSAEPVFDELVSVISEMTASQLVTLRDHLRSHPLQPFDPDKSYDKH